MNCEVLSLIIRPIFLRTSFPLNPVLTKRSVVSPPPFNELEVEELGGW